MPLPCDTCGDGPAARLYRVGTTLMRWCTTHAVDAIRSGQPVESLGPVSRAVTWALQEPAKEKAHAA